MSPSLTVQEAKPIVAFTDNDALVDPGAFHMIHLWRRGARHNGEALPCRSAFVMAEALGLIAGPFVYWRARRQASNSSAA
jgi:hypothetical protein